MSKLVSDSSGPFQLPTEPPLCHINPPEVRNIVAADLGMIEATLSNHDEATIRQFILASSVRSKLAWGYI